MRHGLIPRAATLTPEDDYAAGDEPRPDYGREWVPTESIPLLQAYGVYNGAHA